MNPSERPVRRTLVPIRSIACRAARIRSTASSRSKSGAAGSPVESSIERPAIPVSTARATFAATASGSIANPPSKSAFTGTSTASAMPRRCLSISSSETGLSRAPSDQANPELVVASAGKPSAASVRALPRSHGFGMTKQPDWWSARNEAMRLGPATEVMAGEDAVCRVGSPVAVAPRSGRRADEPPVPHAERQDREQRGIERESESGRRPPDDAEKERERDGAERERGPARRTAQAGHARYDAGRRDQQPEHADEADPPVAHVERAAHDGGAVRHRLHLHESPRHQEPRQVGDAVQQEQNGQGDAHPWSPDGVRHRMAAAE